MTGVRALTLHQPWASLVALGAKNVETRSRPAPVSAVGERLVIHAAKRIPPNIRHLDTHGRVWWRPSVTDPYPTWWADDLDRYIEHSGETSPDGREWSQLDLPLGAVVASATLTACLPIVTILPAKDRAPGTPPYPDHDHLALYPVHAAHQAIVIRDGKGYHVDDQLTFGDFRPGRWAWLLGDVKPTGERCPWCWGGARCQVCNGTGCCEPIPAKGRPGLWRWEP